MAGGDGNLGYWLIQRGGGISPFGTATNAGMPFTNVSAAGIADAGGGEYWVADADGGVFAFGGAPFFGSMGGTPLNAPIVGIAATPDHGGYWLGPPTAASMRSATPRSTARSRGPAAGASLNQPVVGIAGSQDGKGYWLVAADGGVFSFGDAHFWGSMGGTHLNKPVVGMAQDRWAVTGSSPATAASFLRRHVLRLPRGCGVERAGDGDRGHQRRPGLLDGRRRWRCLRLRRRTFWGSARLPTGQPSLKVMAVRPAINPVDGLAMNFSRGCPRRWVRSGT